jgi:hypothetical protein
VRNGADLSKSDCRRRGGGRASANAAAVVLPAKNEFAVVKTEIHRLAFRMKAATSALAVYGRVLPLIVT